MMTKSEFTEKKLKRKWIYWEKNGRKNEELQAQGNE
jgi:hypothetical protein